jgi:hypothetical protein
MHSVVTWLLHVFGVEPRTASTAYNFWSGVGSDLTEFAILGVVWHRLNCHSKGCFRLGLHHVEGTPYVCCRRHAPNVPDKGPTHSDIIEAHRQSKMGA